MKVVFFGTPEIAVPFLEDLCGFEKIEVAAVVSQPDKPAGRSLKVQPTPVKKRALDEDVMVFQPASPSDIVEDLKAIGPDLAITCAYGRILKPDVLAVPALGCLNIHFSLLPKYRGAAPIAWALLNGETRTGISIFWMDPGMDTGPLLIQRELEIGPDEDAPALAKRLVALGRAALLDGLDLIQAGSPPRVPQQGEASLAPKLTKELGYIDWSMTAEQVHNRVRALRDWPRAWIELESGKQVQLWRTRLESRDGAGEPGRIRKIESEGGFLIECTSGTVWVDEVQPEGRSPMSGASFLNGARLKVGDKL